MSGDVWDGKPACPQHDGWHWLKRGDADPLPLFWIAGLADGKPSWAFGATNPIYRNPTEFAGSGWCYLGPATPPADAGLRERVVEFLKANDALGEAVMENKRCIVELRAALRAALTPGGGNGG